MVEGVCRKSMH
jgi:hypothetical protein